ncbi:mono-functional DNA-alkylating methyl methanesulfonate N-term-domain-containing protein [Powellomyces hirtus]|nr:mono-functional DNA-alkylating methyl methanesulfonate N-term-domain-containing protein [Powellomyces hirtus]
MSLSGSTDAKYAFIHHLVKSPVVSAALISRFEKPNHLTEDQAELIWIKETTLEIKHLDCGVQPAQTVSVTEQQLFGHIRAFAWITVPIRPPTPNDADVHYSTYLVCTSDSGYLSFLDVEDNGSGNRRLVSVQQVPIAKSGLLYDELGHTLAVDPLSRAIAVSALDGTFQIWLVSNAMEGIISSHQSVTIRENGIIWQMAFLYPTPSDQSIHLAILQNVEDALSVVIYKIEPDQPLDTAKKWAQHTITNEAVPSHIFPLREIPGAFIMITDIDMHFVRVSGSQMEVIELPPLRVSYEQSGRQIVVAAIAAPPTPLEVPCRNSSRLQSIYLGTEKGHLFRMDFDANSMTATSHYLFNTEKSIKALSLVSSGNCIEDVARICVFGDMCDGMLLSVYPTGEVLPEMALEDWSPVLDFKLADLHREGHDAILLTSGAGNHGSLREVRNGIAATTLAAEEEGMHGATAIWSLKKHTSDVQDTFLVISFIEETRVMSIEGGELEDLDRHTGFNTGIATLHAANLSIDQLHVQIHSKGVVVTDLSNTTEGLAWTPTSGDDTLVGGCISGELIMVWVGGTAIALRVICGKQTSSSSSMEIIEVKRVQLDVGPSCFYSFSVTEGADRLRQLCAVGTFDSSLLLLSLDDATCLDVVAHEPLAPLSSGSISIPHSFLALANSSGVYLLTGLRDGKLATLSLTPSPDPTAPDRILLNVVTACQVGILPVHLVPGFNDSQPGAVAVAFSDSAWRIEMQAGYEPALTGISCARTLYATPFSYPGVARGFMTLAKGTLQFVELDKEKKNNIRTIELREVPRRILFDQVTRRAVISTTSKPSGPDEKPFSEIRVVDPISGKVFLQEKLQPNEKVYSLIEWNVKEGKRYICVGTWGYRASEESEQKGRVLVYNLKGYEKKEKTSLKVVMYKMKQLGEIVLDGPVQSICPFLNSYLLAAAGDVFYQLKIDANSRKLVVRTSAPARWPIQCISVAGNRVVIGGQKESVSFWDYVSDSKKFKFRQSDRYARAVADCIAVDEDTALATDKCGNLLGLGTSDGIEKTFKTLFSIHLGETILRLHRGSIVRRPGVSSKLGITGEATRLQMEDAGGWGTPGNEDDMGSFGGAAAGDISLNQPVSKVLYGCSVIGSVFAVLRISPAVYHKLLVLQRVLAKYPTTRPLLGNDYVWYRSQGLNHTFRGCIDGDMVSQFFDLSLEDKEEVLRLWNRDWTVENPLMTPPLAAAAAARQQLQVSAMDPHGMEVLIRALQDQCA